ncbi:MAG: glycosyltransferase [Clostridiaceae bacterium]|jgi:processive 1,2-diacylglycerol beta-glucosyltransferase|nr:glycosyltransferase [Clostridiaceae bacterium]
MNALFLTVTAGQGHNSASFALARYLESQGVECTVLDTYKYLSKLIGEIVDVGYKSIARHSPRLHLLMYDNAEKVSEKEKMRKTFLPYTIAEASKSKMQKYIDSKKPDVIVCTHIFTAIIVSRMRQDGVLDARIPVFGIVTDFTLHPFWEDTVLDYYVVANELLVHEARRKGMDTGKLLPFGIPVKEEFSEEIPASEARAKLNLRDKMTLLVVSSSVGFGNIPEIVSDIGKVPMDFQIVVICGRNTRLSKKITETHYNKDVIVVGYVDNMELYMDAADVIITKPGGLTVSEALTKRKPLIITDPIPGVENRNAYFLINNDLAVYAGKYARICDVIMQLHSHPGKIDQMRRAQEVYGKRHSARMTGDFMIDLIK